MKRSLLRSILVLLIWSGAVCTYASGYSNDMTFAAGDRNFLVPNLPNIGNTPFFAAIPDLSAPQNATLWRGFFNTSLETMLQGFGGMHTDINLYFIDIFSIFDQYAVSSRDWQDLFWTDGFHPSATGHEVIDQTATVAAHPVPEPGSSLLLASGMAGIAWFKRRKTPARRDGGLEVDHQDLEATSKSDQAIWQRG